jgi:hypothetical protein
MKPLKRKKERKTTTMLHCLPFRLSTSFHTHAGFPPPPPTTGGPHPGSSGSNACSAIKKRKENATYFTFQSLRSSFQLLSPFILFFFAVGREREINTETLLLKNGTGLFK